MVQKEGDAVDPPWWSLEGRFTQSSGKSWREAEDASTADPSSASWHLWKSAFTETQSEGLSRDDTYITGDSLRYDDSRTVDSQYNIDSVEGSASEYTGVDSAFTSEYSLETCDQTIETRETEDKSVYTSQGDEEGEEREDAPYSPSSGVAESWDSSSQIGDGFVCGGGELFLDEVDQSGSFAMSKDQLEVIVASSASYNAQETNLFLHEVDHSGSLAKSKDQLEVIVTSSASYNTQEANLFLNQVDHSGSLARSKDQLEVIATSSASYNAQEAPSVVGDDKSWDEAASSIEVSSQLHADTSVVCTASKEASLVIDVYTPPPTPSRTSPSNSTGRPGGVTVAKRMLSRKLFGQTKKAKQKSKKKNSVAKLPSLSPHTLSSHDDKQTSSLSITKNHSQGSTALSPTEVIKVSSTDSAPSVAYEVDPNGSIYQYDKRNVAEVKNFEVGSTETDLEYVVDIEKELSTSQQDVSSPCLSMEDYFVEKDKVSALVVPAPITPSNLSASSRDESTAGGSAEVEKIPNESSEPSERGGPTEKSNTSVKEVPSSEYLYGPSDSESLLDRGTEENETPSLSMCNSSKSRGLGLSNEMVEDPPLETILSSMNEEAVSSSSSAAVDTYEVDLNGSVYGPSDSRIVVHRAPSCTEIEQTPPNEKNRPEKGVLKASSLSKVFSNTFDRSGVSFFRKSSAKQMEDSNIASGEHERTLSPKIVPGSNPSDIVIESDTGSFGPEDTVERETICQDAGIKERNHLETIDYGDNESFEDFGRAPDFFLQLSTIEEEDDIETIVASSSSFIATDDGSFDAARSDGQEKKFNIFSGDFDKSTLLTASCSLWRKQGDYKWPCIFSSHYILGRKSSSWHDWPRQIRRPTYRTTGFEVVV